MDVLEEFFPSKHLKADDLKDKEVHVTIDRIEREKLGDDMKPVLYFQGKQKGLVLNKGNAQSIADAFGRDSRNWVGQEVVLLSIWTEYQGKPVKGLRVHIPPRVQHSSSDPRSHGPDDSISSGPAPRRAIGGISDNMDRVQGGGSLNDDIPFAAEFR